MEIIEFFEDVDTEREYNGYYYSVGEALTIVILGTFCGLKNIRQIHQWADNERIRNFLKENFSIDKIPCYYWLTCLIKIINPSSFNQCFIKWIESVFIGDKQNLTVSCDGKTIRSTCAMKSYDSPLHIISAQIAELGITFAQESTKAKSNEIPAVQELLEKLNISGCMIVADALNCQKATAEKIRANKADYLLCVKKNHKTMYEDVTAYTKTDKFKQSADKFETHEKGHGRVESRICYTTDDIKCFGWRKEWKGLKSVGVIHRITSDNKGTRNEWHYYICSKKITAEEMLRHARLEWSVETMHWLLDVHFDEDGCRVLDKNLQKNLNMARKIVLNQMRLWKQHNNPQKPFSHIMLDCLLNPECIVGIIKN